MKYLKYFESKHDRLISKLKISEDEIKECFYDLSDEGWKIKTRFDARMVNAKVSATDKNISFNIVPFIDISIKRDILEKVSVVELQDLQLTPEYIEFKKLLNSRLEDYLLFIQRESIERMIDGGSQIKILIYRKSDENLLNLK